MKAAKTLAYGGLWKSWGDWFDPARNLNNSTWVTISCPLHPVTSAASASIPSPECR